MSVTLPLREEVGLVPVFLPLAAMGPSGGLWLVWRGVSHCTALSVWDPAQRQGLRKPGSPLSREAATKAAVCNHANQLSSEIGLKSYPLLTALWEQLPWPGFDPLPPVRRRHLLQSWISMLHNKPWQQQVSSACQERHCSAPRV